MLQLLVPDQPPADYMIVTSYTDLVHSLGRELEDVLVKMSLLPDSEETILSTKLFFCNKYRRI